MTYKPQFGWSAREHIGGDNDSDGRAVKFEDAETLAQFSSTSFSPAGSAAGTNSIRGVLLKPALGAKQRPPDS